jgi:hypothetical protein
MDRVHQIALAVSNIGEALVCYHDHFGVETIYEDGSSALLRFDDFLLPLSYLTSTRPTDACLDGGRDQLLVRRGGGR